MTDPRRSSQPGSSIQVYPSTSEARPEQAKEAASWVQSLFQPNPMRSSLRDWSQKKVQNVGFAPESQDVRRAQSMGAADPSEKARDITSSLHGEVSIEMLPRTSDSESKKSSSKIGRKSKPAPVPPVREKGPTVRINFSYDTLKERADVWRRERDKKPIRTAIPERDENVILEGATDQDSPFPPEASQGTPVEDNQRPKICFTKEESDKVDKDILRLMGALEHNRYPFNRDKQHLFEKLRSTRRKQMGLLFAHRELDNTNYFNTEQESFGYDVISDKLGTMYNVIDSISRDVYELRELLYYERKNQIPPRKGSSDRRNSVNQASTSGEYVPQRDKVTSVRNSSADKAEIPGKVTSAETSSSSSKQTTRSPSRPILKRSGSSESFKSAKSDDSNDTVTESP